MEKFGLPFLTFMFLLIGAAFSFGFTIFLLRRRSFLKKALETSGLVIQVDVSRTTGSQGMTGRTYHYPIVRFQTVDGRVVDCKIKISFAGVYYNVGEWVKVNYDPQNPCRFTQLGDRKSMPLKDVVFFILAGIVAMIIGLGLLASLIL